MPMTFEELETTRRGGELRGVADNVVNQLRQLTRSTLDAWRPSKLVSVDRFQGQPGDRSALKTTMQVLAVFVLTACAVAGESDAAIFIAGAPMWGAILIALGRGRGGSSAFPR